MVIGNTLGPYLGWGLGDDLTAISVSLMFTLLAGFLERPAHTDSGIQRYALCHSIRANVISMIVGMLVAIAILSANSLNLYVLFVCLAIPFSIVVERAWLLITRASQPSPLRWQPLVTGNLMSGIAMFAIFVVGMILASEFREWGFVRFAKENKQLITLGSAGICLAAFAFAFVYPMTKYGLEEPIKFLDEAPKSKLPSGSSV